MKERTIPKRRGVFKDEAKVRRLVELIDQNKSRVQIPLILSREFKCEINTNHVAGARGRLLALWEKEGSLVRVKKGQKAAPSVAPAPKRKRKPRVKKVAEVSVVEVQAQAPQTVVDVLPPVVEAPRVVAAREPELSARLKNPKLYQVSPEAAVAMMASSLFTNNTCQWVEGDALSRKFCMTKAKPGKSYCEVHDVLVFQQPGKPGRPAKDRPRKEAEVA